MSRLFAAAQRTAEAARAGQTAAVTVFMSNDVMNLVLHLSPETEAKLLRQAVLAGKRPEELAMNALEEQLAAEGPVMEAQTAQQWVADFHR